MTKLFAFLKSNSYILSVTGLSTFLSFFMIGSKSYWFDEVFTVIITRNFFDMWNILHLQEGNNWFYMLLILGVQKLGSSEAVIRGFSAVFAVLSIPALFVLVKNILNEKSAKIASLLMAVNFLFIYYAQEARAYTLLLFLTILSSIFFYRSFQKTTVGNLSWYVLITMLGIYTHVYAGLVMISQGILLLPYIKKIKLTRWFIAYSIILISILPLLLAPSFNGHQVNWIPKPEITAPIGTFAILSSDSKIVFSLFSVFSAITLINFLNFIKNNLTKKETFSKLFLLSYLFVPIVAAFVISIIAKPIYQSIYFIFSLPPLLAIVSYSLSKIKSRWLFRFLITVILCLSFWRLVGWYSEDNNNSWIISNQHEHWRETAALVLQNSKPTDAIIFYPYFVREPFELYFQSQDEKAPDIVELSPTPYLLGGGSKIENPNPEKIQNLAKTYPQIWFIYCDITDSLNRNAQRQEIQDQLSNYYRITREFRFQEIHVVSMSLK